MIPITTKDHLVYFMQTGVISLGKYDLKFIQNILYILTKGSPLTTNQVALFEKLIVKYKRQLTKQGISQQKLDSLLWEVPIVPSDAKYTEAYISIEDNKINFKAPFNKKFIEKFRKQEDNNFVWVKEEKKYSTNFNIHSLKLLIDTSFETYPVINYCATTLKLLDSLQPYDEAKYWNPTLVNINGNYLIAAANEHVLNAIANVSLEPTVKNLYQLSKFGVTVDSQIIGDDPLLDFASKFIVELDYVNSDLIVNYLKAIECDAVLFCVGGGLLINHRKILQQKLLDNMVINVHNTKVDNLEKLNYKNLVVIRSQNKTPSIFDIQYKDLYKYVSKIIVLRDSSPVNLI